MRKFRNLGQLTPAQRVAWEIPLMGVTDEEVETLRAESSQLATSSAERFDTLHTHITFIGYPRSGHSIIGSLLDAHPEVLVAHELDTLRFVDAGFQTAELYWLLAENSRRFTELGRRWGRYSYAVPEQSQGKSAAPRVIGDNKGGRSTIRLALNPALLDQLMEVIPLQHRFIHVVRNPFDNITTIAKRQTRDRIKAAHLYFNMCATNFGLCQRLGSTQVFELHHETFISNPRGELKRLCRFLGVEPDQDYLNACASIVYQAPHKSRSQVHWPPAFLAAITKEIAKYPFLSGYSFDS